MRRTWAISPGIKTILYSCYRNALHFLCKLSLFFLQSCFMSDGKMLFEHFHSIFIQNLNKVWHFICDCSKSLIMAKALTFLEFYKSRIVKFLDCTSSHFQLSCATIKNIFPKGERGVSKCKQSQSCPDHFHMYKDAGDNWCCWHKGHDWTSSSSHGLHIQLQAKAFVLEIPRNLLWCNCIDFVFSKPLENNIICYHSICKHIWTKTQFDFLNCEILLHDFYG